MGFEGGGSAETVVVACGSRFGIARGALTDGAAIADGTADGVMLFAVAFRTTGTDRSGVGIAVVAVALAETAGGFVC